MNVIMTFLQVPGQLLGSGTVELAVSYADSRDVLYLRMAEQSAIFAIPGKKTYPVHTHLLACKAIIFSLY